MVDTTYAGIQGAIAGIDAYEAGDYAKLPDNINSEKSALVDSGSVGISGNTGIDVATFAWVIASSDNTRVTQFYNSSTSSQLAGPVIRKNNYVWNNGLISQGWSATVQTGTQVNIAVEGAELAWVLTNGNGTAGIQANDGVYINQTTNVAYAYTTAPSSGYTDTGYKVINPSPSSWSLANSTVASGSTAGVIISNNTTF